MKGEKKSVYEIFKEVKDERAKYFKEAWNILKKMKAEFSKYLQDVNLYVFGSFIKGNYTLGSDIDVLVVSPNFPERMIDRVMIELKVISALKLNLIHPFEIHLVRPEEFKRYEKFIYKMLEIREVT